MLNHGNSEPPVWAATIHSQRYGDHDDMVFTGFVSDGVDPKPKFVTITVNRYWYHLEASINDVKNALIQEARK